MTTGWLALALVFLRALLLRCILVRRRSLAMEAARQRRAAMQDGRETGRRGLAFPRSFLLPAEPDLDLAAINTQARRLVEYVLASPGGRGRGSGSSGSTSSRPSVCLRASTSGGRSTTYGTWLPWPTSRLAILIAMTAFSAAKNIPGLLGDDVAATARTGSRAAIHDRHGVAIFNHDCRSDRRLPRGWELAGPRSSG